MITERDIDHVLTRRLGSPRTFGSDIDPDGADCLLETIGDADNVEQAAADAFTIGVEAARLEQGRRVAAFASAVEHLLEAMRHARKHMVRGRNYAAAASALDYLLELDFGHGDRESDERLYDALEIVRRELGR